MFGREFTAKAQRRKGWGRIFGAKSQRVMGVLLTSMGGVAILVGDVKDVEQR